MNFYISKEFCMTINRRCIQVHIWPKHLDFFVQFGKKFGRLGQMVQTSWPNSPGIIKTKDRTYFLVDNDVQRRFYITRIDMVSLQCE